MVKLNIFYHYGNKILEYRPQKPENLQKAYLVPRSDFILVFRCALIKNDPIGPSWIYQTKF